MIVTYAINNRRDTLAEAHIVDRELYYNERTIYFGGNAEKKNKIFTHSPKRVKDSRILEKFESFDEFSEAFIECVITHEWLHILIFDATGSMRAHKYLDVIDDDDQISGNGFWKVRGCE